MSIRDTAIWEEIVETIEEEKPRVHYRYTCQIEIDDEIFHVQKLLHIDVTRQYNSKFADEVVLKALISEGFYSHTLIPNKDRFKVIVRKEPVRETNGEDDYDEDIEEKVYRGVLLDYNNPKLESTRRELTNEEQTDRLGYEERYIQLYDLAAEKFRMKTVSGIYRGMRVDDFIQGMMTYLSADLKLDDSNAILGVDIVPSDNDDVRDHITMPTIKAISLPTFIQDICGIYNHDIGYYLQDNLWYVYPLYNVRRFDKEPRNLTIFNIPEREMPGIERTWIKEDDQLSILANGVTKHHDDSESFQLNMGNGFRFLNADRVIDSFATGRGDNTNIDYDSNMVEFVTEHRRNSLNMVMLSDKQITANFQAEASTLASRHGSYIQVQWSYADPQLIYPGMPVKYVYLDDEDLKEIYGVVLGADHITSLKGQGITAREYETSVVLTIFIENEKEI